VPRTMVSQKKQHAKWAEAQLTKRTALLIQTWHRKLEVTPTCPSTLPTPLGCKE